MHAASRSPGREGGPRPFGCQSGCSLPGSLSITRVVLLGTPRVAPKVDHCRDRSQAGLRVVRAERLVPYGKAGWSRGRLQYLAAI
jgi:hypothetical protein